MHSTDFKLPNLIAEIQNDLMMGSIKEKGSSPERIFQQVISSYFVLSKYLFLIGLVTCILIIILTSSCAPQRIGLGNKEKKLEKRLRTELNCPDLELRHDYNAIDEKRNNGSFDVLLCDKYCSMDSTLFKELALKITSEITPILNYKIHYEQITFYTTTEEHLSEKSSIVVCSKTVQILLNNPNKVKTYEE